MSDDGGSSGGHGGPVWLLTYCDLITLLVAFFVMMISFATINVNKYKEDIPKIEESFDPNSWSERSSGFFDEGVMTKSESSFAGTGESLLEGGKKPVGTISEKDLGLSERIQQDEQNETEDLIDSKEMYHYLSNVVNESGLSQYISIEDVKIGCKIKIPIKSCFERNESVVKREAHELLDALGAALRMMRGKIVIDANVRKVMETQGEFSKKVDLSVERGANLCDFFVMKENIAPQRIAISGYHGTDVPEENIITIMVFKK
jgi:chemotaxis protein MotB